MLTAGSELPDSKIKRTHQPCASERNTASSVGARQASYPDEATNYTDTVFLKAKGGFGLLKKAIEYRIQIK
jgi:hypothetical protein